MIDRHDDDYIQRMLVDILSQLEKLTKKVEDLECEVIYAQGE